MTPYMLTTAEVAEIIHETPHHVGKRCFRGDFPGAVRPGRAWLIPPSAVDAFLTPKAPQPVLVPEPVYTSPRVKRLAQKRAAL